MTLKPKKKSNGEYWQFMRSRRLLMRVHTKPRSHLFTPVDMSKSPINLKRLGCSRTTVMLKDGMVDFMQDNWKVKVDYTRSMGSGRAKLSSGSMVPI